MDNLIQSLELANGKVTKSLSFDGYEFDTEADSWVLNKNKVINTACIASYSSSVQDNIRSTLTYYAEQKSAAYVDVIQKELKAYLATGETEFTELGLLAFKSLMGKKNERRIATLRTYLKQMYSLNNEAINEECLELINGWRLSGGERGIPVLSLCPEDGPFSDIEFEAILNGLDNDYAEDKLNDEGYSIVQLFTATGRRPIQLAMLKIGDLRVDIKILGTPTYILNIPRAKVRGGGFRAEFTDFAITESIGQVLEKHIKQVVHKANRILDRSLREDEIKLLPLFPDYNDLALLKGLSSGEVINWLKKDVIHLKTSVLRNKLKIAVDSLSITSERTGERLKVNPYRFRYTLGTRAARENAGVLTIATLLDHLDTQHADVYVQNHPDFATTISAIMNGPLIKYANAFQGKLVKGEAEAQKKFSEASRIRTDESKDDVGSCGTSAFCRDHAPIACYLCKKFMPWQDAPHHLILRDLVEERDRISKETGDLAIAAINDRAIIAVTQVIKQCNELNRGKE